MSPRERELAGLEKGAIPVTRLLAGHVPVTTSDPCFNGLEAGIPAGDEGSF